MPPPPESTPTPNPSPATTSSTPTYRRPVTIAFAGDIHFESFLAPRLDHPRTALGPMARTLAAADLSIVNLETAVTTRGEPQPKEFTFRAPPAAFTALKAAGVDVTTMANNHGLDYGPVSVPDALAAARGALDAGDRDRRERRAGLRAVDRQRARPADRLPRRDRVPRASEPGAVLVRGCPTAPDSRWRCPGATPGWSAAVEQVRPLVDTVVVDMHWGDDALQSCPTPWQRTLARRPHPAGADIVVGQHEHILQGAGYLGSAYVAYGLGNFQFYVPNGGETAQTGVLVLTVDGRRVSDPRWVPGEIVDGLPTPLGGAAATAAQQRWSALRGCAGLRGPAEEPRKSPGVRDRDLRHFAKCGGDVSAWDA